MSIHIATKGLCRSPPWAKKFWGKNSQGCWRLLKAPKAFWGPRKVPGTQRGPGRLRGQEGWEGVRGSKGGKGEQGKQGPWVWLKTKDCRRLLKAPKASWGPRKVLGVPGRLRGEREQEGVRGVRGSKGIKAPESDWRPKAAKGLWRLPRLPEAPGRSQWPREA